MAGDMTTNQSENGSKKVPCQKSKTKKSGRESSGGRSNFIIKTLREFASVFENEFFCEYYAGKNALLQNIDPRVKLLLLVLFIVFSAFSSNVVVLLFVAFIVILYAKSSDIKVGSFIRRSWAYIPPLAFLFSLPGALNIFVKGTAVLHITENIYFTQAGLLNALRIALRTGISLSFGFLLLMTTRWQSITRALCIIHVPTVFVSILNMAYRYIFMLSSIGTSMFEARYLRTVGKIKTKENRNFVGKSIAHLFIKSHFLTEEISQAMECRCFSGTPLYMEELKLRSADIVFLIANVIIMLILVFLGYVF